MKWEYCYTKFWYESIDWHLSWNKEKSKGWLDGIEREETWYNQACAYFLECSLEYEIVLQMFKKALSDQSLYL